VFSSGDRNRNLLVPLIVVVAVAIAVTLLQLCFFHPEGALSQIVSEMTMPGKALFSKAGCGLRDLWDTLGSITTIRKENAALKEKNAALQAEIEQTKVYKDENISLRNILELKKQWPENTIAGEIFGRDPTNWYERFDINKGRNQGVTRKCVVMTPEGLVGQITAVSANTSTIRTIINPRSAIPVYVVESGTYGILYGDGTPMGTMKYIRNIAFLQEGHLVVTSGLGEVFPQGILIGRITKVQGTVDSQSSFAKIKPFVDFDSIRHVLVVKGKQ